MLAIGVRSIRVAEALRLFLALELRLLGSLGVLLRDRDVLEMEADRWEAGVDPKVKPKDAFLSSRALHKVSGPEDELELEAQRGQTRTLHPFGASNAFPVDLREGRQLKS
jgi:hypothetical protein